MRVTAALAFGLLALMRASQRKEEKEAPAGKEGKLAESSKLAVSSQKRPGNALAGGEEALRLDGSTRTVNRAWPPMPMSARSRSPSPARRRPEASSPVPQKATPAETPTGSSQRPIQSKAAAAKREPELKGINVQFDYGPPPGEASESSGPALLAPNLSIENVSSFSLSNSSSGTLLHGEDVTEEEGSLLVKKARTDKSPRRREPTPAPRERAKSLSYAQGPKKRSFDKGTGTARHPSQPKSDQEGELVKVTETRKEDGGFTRNFEISTRRAKGRSLPRPRRAIGAGQHLLESDESGRIPTADGEDSSGDGPFTLFQPDSGKDTIGRKHGAIVGNPYDPHMWHPPGQSPPPMQQPAPWVAQMLLLQQQQQALMSTALGMPPPPPMGPMMTMGGMPPLPGQHPMMTKQTSRTKFNTVRPRSAHMGQGIGLFGTVNKLGSEFQDSNQHDIGVDLAGNLFQTNNHHKDSHDKGGGVAGHADEQDIDEDEDGQLVPYTPQMIWHPFYGWIPMPTMAPDPSLRHPDDEPESAVQPIDATVFIDMLAATKKGKMALETTWKFIRMGAALGGWIGVVLIIWFLGLENMILGIPTGDPGTGANTTNATGI